MLLLVLPHIISFKYITVDRTACLKRTHYLFYSFIHVMKVLFSWLYAYFHFKKVMGIWFPISLSLVNYCHFGHCMCPWEREEKQGKTYCLLQFSIVKLFWELIRQNTEVRAGILFVSSSVVSQMLPVEDQNKEVRVWWGEKWIHGWYCTPTK